LGENSPKSFYNIDPTVVNRHFVVVFSHQISRLFNAENWLRLTPRQAIKESLKLDHAAARATAIFSIRFYGNTLVLKENAKRLSYLAISQKSRKGQTTYPTWNQMEWRKVAGWPDEFVKKITQNVAQTIFLSNLLQ
jgi:hypothetical protein